MDARRRGGIGGGEGGAKGDQAGGDRNGFGKHPTKVVGFKLTRIEQMGQSEGGGENPQSSRTKAEAKRENREAGEIAGRIERMCGESRGRLTLKRRNRDECTCTRMSVDNAVGQGGCRRGCGDNWVPSGEADTGGEV
jgi:hypothetical protein